MTDSRKKQGKSSTKTKKLQVNKETLKDLTAKDSRQVKGGRIPPCMTNDNSCDAGA